MLPKLGLCMLKQVSKEHTLYYELRGLYSTKLIVEPNHPTIGNMLLQESLVHFVALQGHADVGNIYNLIKGRPAAKSRSEL